VRYGEVSLPGFRLELKGHDARIVYRLR